MTRTMVFALICVAAAGSRIAAAQEYRAVVVEPAPVYLLPDATRTPLRTLPVNTQVRVLAREGDWIQVEFRDAQFGARVGYVAAAKVRIEQVDSRRRPEPEAQPPPRSVPETQRGGRANPSRIGGMLYGTYGGTAFAAADTFKAITGSELHTNFGGGVTVTRVWHDVFVDVGLSQTKVDGHRVFVDDGTVYSLGIPLHITVRPLDAAGGWRLTHGRYSLYGGGGITLLWYRETSSFSDADDDVTKRRAGPLGLGGADIQIVNSLYVGAEVRYRAVKGILGEGGASQLFGENQAGGLSASVRVSVGK